MSPEPRFLLADDHPLFRGALRWTIEQIWPGAIIEEVDSLTSARAAVLNAPPDLLILDLKLPDSDGFVGLVSLRAEFPLIPVVVVSGTEDVATMSNAIALGAQGFVPKSSGRSVLSSALKAVMEGEVWAPEGAQLSPISAEFEALSSLNPSEARILGCLQRGMLNKQIAFEFGIAESTVKKQVSAMLHKLGVVNRTQALVMAQRWAYDLEGGAPDQA